MRESAGYTIAALIIMALGRATGDVWIFGYAAICLSLALLWCYEEHIVRRE